MGTGFHRGDRITDSPDSDVDLSWDSLSRCVGFEVEPINVGRQPMDFCNECGKTTEPEWIFCRSCGNPLDSPEVEAVAVQPIASTNTPKVELISRGWDVVDVDATETDSGAREADLGPELPTDLLESNEVAQPLDTDAVEISVDEVTIVARPEEAVPADGDEGEERDEDEVAERDEVEAEAAIDPSSDRWDHLRPHGQIPGVSDPSRLPAKTSQVAVLITAFSALVSAVLYLFLNTQLDRFADGDISAGAVRDIRAVAEASVLVMAGLAIISLIMFAWWMIKVRRTHPLQFGPAGWIALPAWLGGVALIGYFALQEKTTVADELTANSLIVIGLGLLMLASLAAIRTISRVEIRDRW